MILRDLVRVRLARRFIFFRSLEVPIFSIPNTQECVEYCKNNRLKYYVSEEQAVVTGVSALYVTAVIPIATKAQVLEFERLTKIPRNRRVPNPPAPAPDPIGPQ